MAPRLTVTARAAQTQRLPRFPQRRQDRRRAPRIRRPPMVGVPALAWWRSGPSTRIFSPTWRARSVRMTQGPRTRLTRRAVRSAIAVRKVMYRKTLKAVWYRESPARRVSTARAPPPEGGDESLHGSLHAHPARALDEHAVARGHANRHVGRGRL